jgi:hypothetical protein
LDDTVFSFHQHTPGEIVGAGNASVAPSAADEGAMNAAASACVFSSEFAEDMVSPIISPDSPPDHPSGTVDKDNSLGSKANRGTLRTTQ